MVGVVRGLVPWVAAGLVLLAGAATAAESVDQAADPGADPAVEPGVAETVPAEPAPDLTRFEAHLDGAVAAQFTDYDLAGMTFVLVLDGRMVFSKGYGFADLAARTPVDPARTLFRPGSVSKLFTWTAVMQLVEEGKIDLDAPVSDYVDQFEIPNAFGEPMTMTHILTHAPGLEDGAAGYLFADEEADLMPLAESLARYAPAQVRPPGTYSSYSNWATALAGLVVANVSGMSFEEYVAARIFEPLGMNRATFDEPLPPGLAADFAQGYRTKFFGLEPMGFEFIKNFGPAGALTAAAEDMASFMIAHVQDGEGPNGNRILQADTARLMHSRLFAHDPEVAGMAHGFYEIPRNGERFIGHGGDTIAFHSQLVIQPETDFGFFLSFNAPDGGRARRAIVDAVLDWFYPGDGGAEPAYPDGPLAGSEERIAAITGAYRLNRRSFTKLEAITGLAGDLQVAPAGEGEVMMPVEGLGGRFIEVAPYRFRKQNGRETLLFETIDGKVTRLLIGSVPIVVADRMRLWEAATTHQIVIALALLAAFFVVLNAIRNRGTVSVTGTARWARVGLITAAALYLAFVAGLVFVFGRSDLERMIFDFPPPGIGFVLLLPLLGALATFFCAGTMVAVWRSGDCNVWQRVRYTYVTLVFLALVGVLGYWNLLGWRYF
jgi:CubicO group peptidase (beta-lactamase class C family)